MDAEINLSVIIPVFNDPQGLRATLDSLVNQTNSPGFEIVVVDNDSTDTTPEVISEYESAYPELITGLVESEIQSSYAARNTGIRASKGEIIAFLDADVTVMEPWARLIVDRFAASDVDYLGCNVEMKQKNADNSIFARYDASMGLPVEHYLETKEFAPTCALAVRRDVLEEVGKFDESLVSGGDKEFGRRVSAAGFEMEYADCIKVDHPVRNSLAEHIDKAQRIGKGQAQLWMKYRLGSHPLSPIKLLPPSPNRVCRRHSPPLSLPATYIISYILKLIQFSSILYHWIKR